MLEVKPYGAVIDLDLVGGANGYLMAHDISGQRVEPSIDAVGAVLSKGERLEVSVGPRKSFE